MTAQLYSGIKSLHLTLDTPYDTIRTTDIRSDLVGVKVWYSTTTGFDPALAEGTLAFDGLSQSITISNLEANTQYYVRYAFISAIQPDVYTISGELTQTVLDEASSVYGYLTNDPTAVSTNADGSGADFAQTSGVFKVYSLSEEVTGAGPVYGIVAGSASGGLSATIDSVTGAYIATALTGNSGSITFFADYDGIRVEKTWSIIKARAGSSSPLLSISATGNAFVYQDATASTTTAASITITASLQNITGTITFTAAAYTSSGISLGAVTGTASNNAYTLSSAQFNPVAYTNQVAYVVVTATLGTLNDSFSIYRINNGSEQIIVEQTNQAHTIAANSDGTVPVENYAGSGTIIKVKQGNTYLPVDNSSPYSTGTWRITTITAVGIATDTTPTIGTDYQNFDTHAAMTTDTAYIDYEVTGTTTTGKAFVIITRQSFSKSKTGATGTNAVTINYSNDSLAVPQTNTGVSTWTGSGGVLQVYDGTAVLTLSNTSQSTTTPATNGTYVLNIIKISGDTLTEPTFSGTTTVTLSTWSGTLTTATVYRITAYVRTTSGSIISVSTDVSISPSKAGADATVNYLSISSPVITKQSPDAATAGTHSSVTIQGKQVIGAVVSNYGWVTVTANDATETTTATNTATAPITLAPTSTDGKTSYTIKMYNQATVSGATLLDTEVVSVVFRGATGVDGEPGVDGADGTQISEAIVYQWSSSLPAITGTSTYIWESGTVYSPPSGWFTTLSDTGTAGQTLWKASVAVTDSVTATVTSIPWSSTSIVPFGYVGSTGAVNRVAYTKSTTLLGSIPATYTVSGDALPSSNSWNSNNARVATTATITLSGTQTVDGTVLVVGDRVLVKNQTDTTANGLYVVSSTTWSRAPEANTWSKLLGLKVYVLSGGTHSSSWWVSDTTPTGALGTTPITFTQRPSIVVSCATTANIALSGLQTIDGVVVASGTRVLVKNQTLQQNNGVYTAASGSWTRATDANTWTELVNLNVNVNSGTTNAGTSWLSTVAAGGTLGTTAVTFTSNNTTWSYTTPTAVAGESVWQSEGVYNPTTNQTIWEAPYLASLKVGNLSAVSTNTGSLTVTGDFKAGSASRNSTTMTGSGAIIYNTGTFAIGNATNNITYDGSAITLNGQFVSAGSLSSGSMNAGSASNAYIQMGEAGIAIANVKSALNVRKVSADTTLVNIAAQNNKDGNSTIWGHSANNAIGSGNGVTGSHTSVDTYGSWQRLGALGSGLTNAAVWGVSYADNTSSKAGVFERYSGTNSASVGSLTKSVQLATADWSVFSASGQGRIYISDGSGPFTGFHESLIDKTAQVELGDIVTDQSVFHRFNISNVLFKTALSAVPNQSRVLGVVSEVLPIGMCVPGNLWKIEQTYPEGALSPVTTMVLSSEFNLEELQSLYKVIRVNALGEGQINVCGENGDIEAGDLIVSSSMPGKGMKQNDDLVRNYTVAKARESVKFSSATEIKMIACIYVAG